MNKLIPPLFILLLIPVLFIPSYETTTPKIYLANLLQYVNITQQASSYKSHLVSNDLVNLRSQNGLLNSSYVKLAQGLQGSDGVEYTSLAGIVNNIQSIKLMGFKVVSYNLEPNLSPTIDTNNATLSMKIAADVAHSYGLKFRAAPSQYYTSLYGNKIVKFSDYYLIQAQLFQSSCGNTIDNYKTFVNKTVNSLKVSNPKVMTLVQVSTSQGAINGKSILDTMKICFNEVAPSVDGVSVWFGQASILTMKQFIPWFHYYY